MANVEWLFAGGLLALGLAIGLGIGLFISRKTGKVRDLQDQLASTQSELDEYREQVVTQFSETAHKFKTLNEAYVDLHQQLANSASALCGNAAGPLLEAPGSIEKLIPAEAADEASLETSLETSLEASPEASPEAQIRTSAASEEAGPDSEKASEAVTTAATDSSAEADAETSGEPPTQADAGNDIVVPEPSRGDHPGSDESVAEPTEPRKYGAGS